MTILLYLVLASCAFSLATLAWGCLLAWKRSRAPQRRDSAETSALPI